MLPKEIQVFVLLGEILFAEDLAQDDADIEIIRGVARLLNGFEQIGNVILITTDILLLN